MKLKNLLLFGLICMLLVNGVSAISYSYLRVNNTGGGQYYQGTINTANNGNSATAQSRSSSLNSRGYRRFNLSGYNYSDLQLYYYVDAVVNANSALYLELYYCNSYPDPSVVTWNRVVNSGLDITNCNATYFARKRMDLITASAFNVFNVSEQIKNDVDGLFTINVKINTENFDGTARYVTTSAVSSTNTIYFNLSQENTDVLITAKDIYNNASITNFSVNYIELMSSDSLYDSQIKNISISGNGTYYAQVSRYDVTVPIPETCINYALINDNKILYRFRSNTLIRLQCFTTDLTFITITPYDPISYTPIVVKTYKNNTYTTDKGTITLPIAPTDTNLWNITFFNATGYFNKTYTNYNFSASGNLEGELSSTNTTIIIKFFGTNITANVSNTNLTDWNYSKSFIQANGIFNEPFTAGTNRSFQIKCNRQVFETRNFTLDIDPKSSDTFIVYVNDTRNKLRFLDATNSSAISGATITIKRPSGATITRTTNATGYINFSYINALNNLDFGNYNITFSKIGYTTLSFTEEINSSNIPLAKTYNISRANIQVNIYDRATGNLLTNPVNLFFLTLFNDTTSTGKYNISNVSIIAGTYTIQALSTGYGTEQKTFTYTAQENITVDFYLLNLTDPNAGTFFVNTLTSFYTIISDATVKLMEYSPTELSFIEVSECQSNINGECAFNIELNVKTYYISATKTIDGLVYFDETPTSGEIILTDNEIRNLILFYTEEFEVLETDNIIISITETFVNNISNIAVQFYSIDGMNIEVCIEYFTKTPSAITSVQEDCLTSSSAVQNINANYLLNRSNTYIARVTVGDSLIRTFNYPSKESDFEATFDNNFIGIIILLFWASALGLSLYLKNITFFAIIALFLSWIELLIFPTFTIVALCVFRTVISLIIIYISRKVQDTE